MRTIDRRAPPGPLTNLASVVVGRRERVETWGLGLPALDVEFDPNRSGSELAVTMLAIERAHDRETVSFWVSVPTELGTFPWRSATLDVVRRQPDVLGVVVDAGLQLGYRIWSTEFVIVCDPERSGQLVIGSDAIADNLAVDLYQDYLVSNPLLPLL